MKIEKYNQRLLAILGTLIVVFLIVALIAFISITIIENRRFNNNDKGILSDEKIEQLQKENKREQIISYETPILIDTLKSKYIIPVSYRNLKKKEDINGLLNATSSANYEKTDNRYSRAFYGEFNNVIVYNSINNIKKKLFNKRVNFNDIKTEYFDDDILLLIKASDKDTHKDGVINLDDFKSLYFYSFTQNQSKKIGIENMDVYNYKFLNNSKDLIIEFGVDKNKNGRYENYNEPIIIKKYDFKTGKLINVIDKEMNSELQNTLEGTKK
ncbi:hypothetical protein [Mesonia aquimarina]|uniref:hypothetical protein n=1 Tax=Mesonia aquimarina TaxID=1504967 RepID=UPI000EF56138|nr:hypothetical protein [Mesonia aquimarina]